MDRAEVFCKNMNLPKHLCLVIYGHHYISVDTRSFNFNFNLCDQLKFGYFFVTFIQVAWDYNLLHTELKGLSLERMHQDNSCI